MTEPANAAEHMPGGVIVYPEFQLRNFFKADFMVHDILQDCLSLTIFNKKGASEPLFAKKSDFFYVTGENNLAMGWSAIRSVYMGLQRGVMGNMRLIPVVQIALLHKLGNISG